MPSLVQSLFDGPIDVVGDVHGEIDALEALLRNLGYDNEGRHPERRLVFLGDLTDRGPDSPRVVQLVQRIVESGRGQCVLGNHDLNILLGHPKYDNNWFSGKEFSEDGYIVPQIMADRSTRKWIRAFFETLPLALERSDARVVHACWHSDSAEMARHASNAVDFYSHHVGLIKTDHAARGLSDETDRFLEHQNRDPVKMLTSGPERRIEIPLQVGGKLRFQDRAIWWPDYDEPVFCVFGHYGLPMDRERGDERAFCVDFGVAYRWKERRARTERFHAKLAALRIPEKVVVFDDGISQPLPTRSATRP